MQSEESESTSRDNLPELMFRRGRAEDPVFEPTEPLYKRFSPAEFVPGSSISVRFPEFSVNRGKYSEPEWVLLPQWLDYGIVVFLVRDVPAEMTSEGGVRYTFIVAHAPLEDNYAHSEIRALKEGRHVPRLDVPKTLKKKFRQILAERWRIYRQPRA